MFKVSSLEQEVTAYRAMFYNGLAAVVGWTPGVELKYLDAFACSAVASSTTLDYIAARLSGQSAVEILAEQTLIMARRDW